MLIPKKTYEKLSTKQLARQLLGTFIVVEQSASNHESQPQTTVGRIVETEAYLSRGDPACHAARGMTKRNAMMFGRAGTGYIYLIYGMHLCFNVVSGPIGKGEAVLIRALEPIEGIQIMSARRGGQKENNLCNGPAKLTQAMGMTLDHNGLDLRKGPIKIFEKYPGLSLPKGRIITTTRIGISKGKELPLRFYLENSPHVSRK